MSSKKIKFSVNGINGVGRRTLMHSALNDRKLQNGKGSYYYACGGLGSMFGGLFKVFKFCTAVAGISVFATTVVFTTNILSPGHDNGLAMIFQSIEAAMKKPNYVDGFSVENVLLEDEYLYSGGAVKEVLKLKFTSDGEIFRLKNLKVKVGGVDNSTWRSELVLKDNFGNDFDGDFEDGYVNFENLYFKIDEGQDLELSFDASFPDDLHFGQRIYFEIENPRDIGLSLYGDEVNVKATYPLRGAYFTVVARKRAF